MEHLHPTLATALALLGVVALVAVLARRLAISYPILLILAGLACSLLPQVPDVQLTPEAFFYVFLPPLLYAAAWQTSWREFRANLLPISMLAVGLVFFTAIGVALTARFFLPSFDWRLGFLLGAIASPTDAIAATSIARRIGLPHTVVDLLEGESLLNDATGLLALQFGVSMIAGGAAPTFGQATLQFLWLVGGGALVGVGIGFAVSYLERWIEEGPVEVALSLIVAYAAYLAGEEVHASGVISVVVCGLYLSRQSSSIFSAQSRLQTLSFWDALEFLLNGLVFLLIGFQLSFVMAGIRGYRVSDLVRDGLGFSAVLIALRLIWMFPAAQLAYALRTRVFRQQAPKPPPKAVFLLGWTGMRGAVALAAAGSLPRTLADGRPFPERGVIVFLTFAVILVTLVLQGSSLPLVVRLLRFDQDSGPVQERNEARRALLHAAVRYLEERREQASEVEQHSIDDMLHLFEHRLEELDVPEDAPAELKPAQRLLAEVYEHQRKELRQLRGEGRVGDAVYRTLERELDLGESRLLSRS